MLAHLVTAFQYSMQLVWVEFVLGVFEQGVSAFLGGGEVVVDGLSVLIFAGCNHIADNFLQGSEVGSNGLAIGHADICPHIGIGRGDTGGILETAANEFDTGLHITAGLIQECYQRCRRYMGHMADNGGTAVMFGDIERCKVGAGML